MEFYRQGDVGIIKIDSLPKKAVKQECEGSIVLALGEVTGHKHQIDATEADLYVEGSRRFLEVCYAAELVHEEHGKITLPPGSYEVVIQREYSPEAIRNVND
jgi:hypothetical protein